MIRRAQQARRAEKSVQATVDAELSDQEHGLYAPPDRGDCVERDWIQSIDDADTIRVEPHLWSLNGRPVDLAIIIKVTQLDGAWDEVARVDCCHGHVHLHHRNGNLTHIARLDAAEDVRRVLARALGAAERYAITIRDMKETTHG